MIKHILLILSSPRQQLIHEKSYHVIYSLNNHSLRCLKKINANSRSNLMLSPVCIFQQALHDLEHPADFFFDATIPVLHSPPH